MASEWREVPLGQLCDFVAGCAFPKRAQGSSDGDYPFIKVSDMNLPGNERYITVANNWISETTLQELRAKLHPPGAIVFAKIGVALTYNRRRIIRQPTVIDNNMMSAVPRKEEVDSLFLYYLLSTIDFNLIVSGTALPYLNISDLKQIMVKIPSIDEQRAIAHILGTLDDKIELNRRMNRTLEAMARAIFKSWFVYFDPVRAKAEGRDPGLPKEIADLFPDEFEESEIGEIPKGWRPGTLGVIADNPRQAVKPDEIPPATPYIGLQHMPRRCIALDSWGRADEVGSQKFQFKEGDILFGKLRPYFHKVGIAPTNGVCSTDILVIVPKTNEWHSYVLSLVSSKSFVDYTDVNSSGTKMPRTNWKDMSRYSLALPPVRLVRAFQDHVEVLHKRITLNVRQNRRLTALRDTMLSKLLSGEFELNEDKAFKEISKC